MKRAVLLLTFFSLAIPAIGQELKEVWGLPIHTGKKTAKTLILQKHKILPTVDSAKDMLVYTNCMFNGHKASTVDLFFLNDSLYKVDAYFEPDKEENILKLYTSIKTGLTKKYWPPRAQVENYDDAYKEGHENHLKAIKTGQASIMAIWGFPPDSREGTNGEITLDVLQTMSIYNSFNDGLITNRLRDEPTMELMEAK